MSDSDYDYSTVTSPKRPYSQYNPKWHLPNVVASISVEVLSIHVRRPPRVVCFHPPGTWEGTAQQLHLVWAHIHCPLYERYLYIWNINKSDVFVLRSAKTVLNNLGVLSFVKLHRVSIPPKQMFNKQNLLCCKNSLDLI